jgi:hypothetical protein
VPFRRAQSQGSVNLQRLKTNRWVLLQDIGKAVIRTDMPQQDVLAVIRELAKR